MSHKLIFWSVFYGIITIAWAINFYLYNNHMHLHDNVWQILSMWLLMVMAMMMPTIIPYLRFYNDLRYAKQGQVTYYHLSLFTIGYISCWVGYAVFATIIHMILYSYHLLNHQATITETFLALLIILLAAIYHILPTRLKALSRCQSPMQFFMRYWQPGDKIAFYLGCRHAWDCLYCCWVLMLLMFVGAMADLRLMLLLTCIMVIEKFPIAKFIISYIVSFSLFLFFFYVIFTFISF